MPCLNVVLFFGVFLRLPGRIQSWCEQRDRVGNIDDQYFPINEQVKKENPGYLFCLVINKQGKQPPYEPMVLKYFQTYYFATYGSTVFYW
jgi:hypothetical protein